MIELDGFPDFACYPPVQGMPPHEDMWMFGVGFNVVDGDPRHAEALFFVWFDRQSVTHLEIAEALRQRVRDCLEALE